MNELIQLRLKNPQNCTEDVKSTVSEIFYKIISQVIELNVWDIRISAIIVTDDFANEINKQSDIWDIKTVLSQEKEYNIVGKNLFNNNLDSPEYHIFFDINYFPSDAKSITKIVVSQILKIISDNIIPADILTSQRVIQPESLDDYITLASIEWVKTNYLQTKLGAELTIPDFTSNNNSFLISFKRKLKRSLFEYNSDKSNRQESLNQFWRNYFKSIHTLFIRLIENETDDVTLQIKENDRSKIYIKDVITEIKNLTERCIETGSFDIMKLKEAVVLFSANFDVLLDNGISNVKITLTKNPKDYFIDEIVETEPRIVCFIDILGFSELINQYDSDITSTILQDIQESFALAKENILENKFSKNSEVIRYLKYQTFSDNICISIPYFDNEDDFLSNFNLLISYVRSFQSIMMSKGFFMRGGISVGSYYADNNIIFSKGLVNAYLIESTKAVYPRTVIDNIIIDKLSKYKPSSIKSLRLDSLIVFDWENVAFLNPFGLLDNAIFQFGSMLDAINSKNDDESEPSILSMRSLTKIIGDTTLNLLKSNVKKENENLESIKKKVEECISFYQNNERVTSKYLWLLEFINWFENDSTTKLKFQFMTDRIA